MAGTSHGRGNSSRSAPSARGTRPSRAEERRGVTSLQRTRGVLGNRGKMLAILGHGTTVQARALPGEETGREHLAHAASESRNQVDSTGSKRIHPPAESHELDLHRPAQRARIEAASTMLRAAPVSDAFVSAQEENPVSCVSCRSTH